MIIWKYNEKSLTRKGRGAAAMVGRRPPLAPCRPSSLSRIVPRAGRRGGISPIPLASRTAHAAEGGEECPSSAPVGSSEGSATAAAAGPPPSPDHAGGAPSPLPPAAAGAAPASSACCPPPATTSLAPPLAAAEAAAAADVPAVSAAAGTAAAAAAARCLAKKPSCRLFGYNSQGLPSRSSSRKVWQWSLPIWQVSPDLSLPKGL